MYYMITKIISIHHVSLEGARIEDIVRNSESAIGARLLVVKLAEDKSGVQLCRHETISRVEVLPLVESQRVPERKKTRQPHEIHAKEEGKSGGKGKAGKVGRG